MSSDVWKQILDLTEAHGVFHLPTTQAGARPFLTDVAAWLRQFPKCFGQNPDDQDSVHYVCKHILRKFLLFAIKRTGSAVFEDLLAQDLLDVTPDQKGHMQELVQLAPLKKETWRELGLRFGVPAEWASCWMCLAGQVPTPLQGALDAMPDLELLRLARDFRPGGFAPNLVSLAREVTEGAARLSETEPCRAVMRFRRRPGAVFAGVGPPPRSNAPFCIEQVHNSVINNVLCNSRMMHVWRDRALAKQ